MTRLLLIPRLLLLTAVLVGFALLAGPIRRICVPGGPGANRLTRWLCGSLLWLLRIRLDVRTQPGPGQPARLVIANHVSWIDVLALGSLEPLSFLAKREVGTWPVVSAFATLNATVFVDRQRRRCIPAVNATMRSRLAGGRSVALFPEGTTLDGTRRGPFRTSHLACLMPGGTVQPVSIAYSHPVAAWIGDDTLLPHLWRVLNGPPLVCHLSYGEAVAVPAAFDRKRLGAELALAVERQLQTIDEHAASMTGIASEDTCITSHSELRADHLPELSATTS